MTQQTMPGTLPTAILAEVVGCDDGGSPLVSWPGAHRATVAAVAWLPVTLDWSSCHGLRVLIAFLDGDPEQPIITGLLDAPPGGAPRRAEIAGDPSSPVASTHRQVELIKGRRELRLECGEARIVLRADGRIEIRGGHLLSRSSGINLIKGASVQIN